MRIIVLVFFLIPIGVNGQNEDKIIVGLINQIYQSDSSTFVFGLKQIPTRVIDRVLKANDSLNYLIQKKRTKTKLKRFMADTYDEWNGTDLIFKEKLPRRRFIYGIKLDTKWILTYEHGGRGSHYHIIYFHGENLDKLSLATTLLNWEQLNKLIFDKKVEEISNRPFKRIVKEGEFKIFNGVLIENYDVI